MYGKATTTISILRGSDAVDEFLDVAPADTVKYSKIPASILEQNKTVASPDTAEPIVLRTTTGRVGSGTDIQYGDRIKDERTGTVYQIDDMSQNQSPFSTPDIIMKLSRISNYGTV